MEELSSKYILDGMFLLKSNNIAECTICGIEMKYHRSNSSLNYHLKHKHFLTPTTKFKSNSSLVKQQTIINSAHQQDQLFNASDSKYESNFYTYNKTPSSNSSFEDEKPTDLLKYEIITDSIAKWIARNARPITIVDDSGLRDVIRIASQNNNYNLPDKITVKECIEQFFLTEKEKINLLIKKATHVALTTDFWSSSNNSNFLETKGHFIHNWSLYSITLSLAYQEETQFSYLCANKLSSVMNSWDIFNKVTTLGTDDSQSMTSMAKFMPFIHLPCLAHGLQSSVNEGVRESGYENFLNDCRKIVSHFHQNSINSKELEQNQEKFNQKIEPLVLDIPTKWSSIPQMIELLQRNKEPLLATLVNEKHKLSFFVPCQTYWDKLCSLQRLLEPCKFASHLLKGEQFVPCSVILPTLCHLFIAMTTVPDNDNDINDELIYANKFKNAFVCELRRYKASLNISWLSCATALDPRFKSLRCLPKDCREEMWKNLAGQISSEKINNNAIVSGLKDNEPTQKKLRMLEYDEDDSNDLLTSPTRPDTTFAINLYREEKQVDIDACPLEWWRVRSSFHPALAILAIKYLASPATTVSGERLFSHKNDLIDQKRSAYLSSSDNNFSNRMACLNNWLNLNLNN